MVKIYVLSIYFIICLTIFTILFVSNVHANDASFGIGINFAAEDFVPEIWMCDNRKVIDDDVESGRTNGNPVYSAKVQQCKLEFEYCVTECESEVESFCYQVDGGPAECPWYDQDPNACLTLCGSVIFKYNGKVEGEDVEEFFRDLGLGFIANRYRIPNLDCSILKGYELIERAQNYAFEGEKIEWIVLVMDKNKVEDILDVVGKIGTGDGGGETTITRQDSVTHCGDIPVTSTDWDLNIVLPLFDKNLGDLLSVELNLSTKMKSDIFVEHLSTISPAEIFIDVDGSVIVLPELDGVSLMLNISFDQQTFNSTVYDNVTDFAGTSGATFLNLTATDAISQIVSNITPFIGNAGDMFNINVSAVGFSQVTGSGNIVSSILTEAEAMACVTYDYEFEEVIQIPGGDDIEVECLRLNGFASPGQRLDDSCNARIWEEKLDFFDDQTMAFYECTLTVETPLSMDGEYWITIEACDANGNCDTVDELEYWFFNPIIAVDVIGDIDFGIVRPGTVSYSETILVANEADFGSGVLLDMFISGTDFYDSSPSGGRCSITNRLKLGDNIAISGLNSRYNVCNMNFKDNDDHLCYFATNGAYSTETDPRSDAEGYVPIVYGNTFSKNFYNDAEIMQPIPALVADIGYQPGNILTPGAEIAMTFKLGLPEPCSGDFTDGGIFFWGEAI